MAEANPFDQFDPASSPSPAETNPFDQFGPDPVAPPSSTAGAFARGAERGALPAAGSLAAAGMGAETGAAIGALGGPFAEVTVPAGALVGGVAGALGGGYAVSKAQDWALKQLPDSWREALGQDDRQQQLDEKQHPTASFLGGIAPYALTMTPVGAAAKALPEGATAFQRIMANPVTARIFGGAAMGGMELGQEKAQGAPADWTDVAISTAFGIFFNRPNTLGRALTEIGARPARALLPQPQVKAAAQPQVSPELANDAKVIGPGVTEEVFQGAHEQAPEAAQAAQEAAREQHPALAPDLHAIARRMEPETFTEYDNLSAQREALRNHIADIQSPPKQAFDDLKARQDDLNAKLAAHVESRNGYTGGQEARQLRAQIRDTQTQIDTLSERKAAFAAGEGTETADLAVMRQRLMDTDFKMRDLATQVSAAYRRAADAVGAGTVPPEELPPKVSMENAAQLAAEPVQTETQSKAIDIAKEVAQRLTEAGRPADEALAAGQLVHAHYETRAARFGSKLGSASDIFKAEGPIIQAGRQKTAQLELAQQPLRQTARGKIQLAKGVRPVITLMKNANASTFIHETGHQWLEELSRDAAHEAAPEGLKADAASVLKWLNAKSAEDITTRQHEKFARGFEQYMREGIAPSPTLAAVFAKFNNWLTTIYQTLKGLGKPINEDIRSVFDRMLATEPQRTVIAEHTLGPTLTDIHVADALHTEPAEAEPAMDRVIAETTRYTADLPPEVQNELQEAGDRQAATTASGGNAGNQAAESGGQAQPSQGGSPEVEQNSSRQGAVSGSGAGSGQLGKIEPSRSEAGGEGTRLSAGAGQRSPVEQLAPTPAPFLDAKSSSFIDKAGNIRLDTLTTNEDVKSAIRDAAAENKDFIGDRRGVVTDGQVMDLADALGMDFEQISARKIAQAFNAEQVMAARKLLIQSATAVSDVMKRAATGTDADVMAYAEAKSRHQMIQGQVAGITAEAGRALRAFRNIAGQEAAQDVDQFLRTATGRTLFQLKREAQLGINLETPQQVSKFIKDSERRTFGRMLLEFWINGLISGPATHTTYMIGNTILSAWKAIPESSVAAGIGAVRSALGRPGERVRLGEVGAQVSGAGRGIAPAMKASIESFRSGVTALLPSESPRSMPFQPGTAVVPAYTLEENTKLRDVAASAFGLVRGLRDGFIAAGTLVKGGITGSPLISAEYSPLGAIPDIAVRGVTVLPIGSAARLPSRFIAAIHSFYRSVNFSMEKSAIAYRTAAEEGLHGDAFDARVAAIRANPSDEVMNAAAAESATELTLMGKGSAFTQTLARLTNTEILGFPLFKFIDPFVKIGSNIIDQAILQRTPAGILSPEIRADLMGRNGNIAQDKAQARMMAGTALALTFGSLAAEGIMSGSEPPDRNKAAMWRLAGNQAHSVRIGDMWYDVHRLGPLGMLAGISADMYDVAQNAEKGEYLTAAAELQHAFTQNILDESFMRGPADLIKAIEDPGRYGEAYIRNFLSSFVPYSVGMAQIARAMDPYSRRARTVVDAIKAKVPGVSESLLPNRDIWGESIPNREALGAAGVTSIYEVRASRDPVNLAMLNLGIYPAPVDQKIRNVHLTPQQYDDYARIAGRMAKMRLDVIVNSPDFKTWPLQSQHDVMSEAIRQSRETARGIMMMKNPDIVQQAYKAKTARFAPAGE